MPNPTPSVTARRERERPGVPPFDGALEVLNLIGDLFTRPRRRRSARTLALPMVCLIRPQGHVSLLPAIAQKLKDAARQQVPHAMVDLADEDDVEVEAVTVQPDQVPSADSVQRVSTLLDNLRSGEGLTQLGDQHQEDLRGMVRAVSIIDGAPLNETHVDRVREIVQEIAENLAHPSNQRQGGLRFRRLELAQWLMQLDLSQHRAPARLDELRNQLRSRGFKRRVHDNVGTMLEDAKQTSPSLWTLGLTYLFRLAPALWFALRSSGRVPWLSREFRWFLRQPYLAAERSGSFLEFAYRLTREEWPHEQAEQVLKFLINALLEDLRQEYKWWPLRPSGARRTAYPVVLLDNIRRRNCGYLLLKLINDVRNEIGVLDPLVVVSASQKVPPDAHDPKQVRFSREFDANRAVSGLQYWRTVLDPERRKRGKMAWYLPIRIPAEDPANADGAVLARTRQDVDLAGYEVRRASWASRFGPALLALLLVVVSSSGLLYMGWDVLKCGTWRSWPGGVAELRYANGECIGVTDGSVNLFQARNTHGQDRIVAANLQVQRTIHEQNVDATRLSRNSDRQLITVVHLGALTSSSDRPDGLLSQREALEGVALRQKYALDSTDPRAPILKVLIANAGNSMRQGVHVADLIGRMADRDRSIVGVVGLDQSSTPTVQTIRALTRQGIPMVAAVLTADSLADENPMYFQVAPQNRQAAEVAANFAEHLYAERERIAEDGSSSGMALREKKVRIVSSSDPADTYSINLREDVAASMRARGFVVEPDPVRDTFSAAEAAARGREMCGYPGLVYYAGRGVPDFGSFLNGIQEKCAEGPVILAGDDTSRFVADSFHRTGTFFFQTFAVAPQEKPKHGFYHDLGKLFPGQKVDDSSLDGHAALAYDATSALVKAVEYLRETRAPVTPITVWNSLREVRGEKQLNGVTGVIDFNPGKGVPEGKPVVILRVLDGQVQTLPKEFCASGPDPAERGCVR